MELVVTWEISNAIRKMALRLGSERKKEVGDI